MSTMDSSLDATDKKILTIIQSGFPVVSRPYKEIGEQVGLTEAEALARVRSLRQRNVVRRMGANFNSKGLGWRSTLCAAKVPEDKMEQFIDDVNSIRGVTHNYLRDHEYNVWFTYIGPNWEDVENTLAGITERTGIPVLNLPAKRLYKIKVDFKMDE